MELKDIKKSIYNTISITGYNVYEYTRVPDDATFPYVTYNLISATDGDKDSIYNIDFSLEVDILDYTEEKNTDTIETMTSSVNELLNRLHVIEDAFTLSFYRRALFSQLPTIDEYTFRRQLVYKLDYDERRTT